MGLGFKDWEYGFRIWGFGFGVQYEKLESNLIFEGYSRLIMFALTANGLIANNGIKKKRD